MRSITGGASIIVFCDIYKLLDLKYDCDVQASLVPWLVKNYLIAKQDKKFIIVPSTKHLVVKK